VEDNINGQPWGRKGTFAVDASVYGKVQAEPNSILTTKREEKEKKDASFLP